MKDFGEFYPFAFALDVNDNIVPITTDPYVEFPSIQAVISQLEEEIKISDVDSNYNSVAICLDILYTSSDSTKKTDALEIRIDQRDYKSYNIYVPYNKYTDNSVIFGPDSPENPGSFQYFELE